MSHLETIKNKIQNIEKATTTLQQWQVEKCKIVFTNGCFDILHLGHIDYLAKAADLGDKLIIGVNTDASVSRIKGPSRPINDQGSRAMILASLSFVSLIILFDEPTPYNLIKLVQPDVLVKGADYKIEEIVGYDIVTAKGGKIITLDYLADYSTSGIEKRILEKNKSQM